MRIIICQNEGTRKDSNIWGEGWKGGKGFEEKFNINIIKGFY